MPSPTRSSKKKTTTKKKKNENNNKKIIRSLQNTTKKTRTNARRKLKEEEDLNDKLTNKLQECRAPRLSKKMAQRERRSGRRSVEHQGSQRTRMRRRKCLLTRAEWLYILVEGRRNLGPKQWGNLRPKQYFRPYDQIHYLILTVRAVCILYNESYFKMENRFHHWVQKAQISQLKPSHHVLVLQTILFEAL